MQFLSVPPLSLISKAFGIGTQNLEKWLEETVGQTEMYVYIKESKTTLKQV